MLKFFSLSLLVFSLLTCEESANEKSELNKQQELTIDPLRTKRQLEKARNEMKALEIKTLEAVSFVESKYIEYCDSIIALKKDSIDVTNH